MYKLLTAAVILASSIAMGAHAQEKTFKIGLSNGFAGSEWRTQMIEEAQTAAAAWADKGVNIVTAADRAAAGRKQMDDFIGWKRADGIEAASRSQQPAAVLKYDININGRQAQVTGDMNMKRALDELNNGFS